jgi:predicted metalloprotease with PDZ domain
MTHYAIRPADPGAHLFHVICRVEKPDPQGQLFMLPAWIPGSYMIREFARHIVRITALAGSRKVPLSKLDKHTWRAAPAKGPIEVAYEVYAWDLSVRAAHLDQTHGFFNGACVFLLPIGFEHERCSVDILPPAGDRYEGWRVATGLEPAHGTRRPGFGTYEATDYDELIDCPVELGDFAQGRFDVFGVPHEIVVTGSVPRLDMKRLTSDLARVCEAQVKLFEPRSQRAPFSRFTFLALAFGDGYGGLEHRNSTALLCKREGLPFMGMKDTTEAYRSFLGVASHEYFHSWNVKRIRPADFVPYDLTQENYTRLLWVFEGFTSYYDDLLLARAGLLTEAQYLETIARTMTVVSQRSSRLKQSVADSSFDAWIKYYRQDENASNSVVSYYQKGSLVALALDLTIRNRTAGRRSLDDVMRLLWKQFKAAGPDYPGVTDEQFVRIAEDATSLPLASLIAEWAEGTRDPDYASLLAPFGVRCTRRPALDLAHFALLGVRTANAGGDCKLTRVHDGSPAQAAGFSANDIFVALDGLRVTPANLDSLLARYATGDVVEVLVFRYEQLLRMELKLASQPPHKFALDGDPKAALAARRLRARWLGPGR